MKDRFNEKMWIFFFLAILWISMGFSLKFSLLLYERDTIFMPLQKLILSSL